MLKNFSIKHFRFHLDSTTHSYSQLFFSLNRWQGLVFIFISFFDTKIGLTALISVLGINLIAYVLGFYQENIRSGLYGFNALLLGSALAHTFNWNIQFWVLLFFSIIILLILTAWLQGILASQKLPFLALPFIFTFWIVSASSWFFTRLSLDHSRVYISNTKKLLNASAWYQMTQSLENSSIPTSLGLYFKSLSSVFFTHSILAGIIVSLSILFYSRIAFVYTLLSFYAAYSLFNILGIDTSLLENQLVGSNFIFVGMALGCFFLIPNRYSLILIMIIAPIITMIHLFISNILGIFHLPAYTISFCIVTLLILYFLNQRWFKKWLIPPIIQYYSPEKTIYKHLNDKYRYRHQDKFHLSLPFWGEWMVSQGYEGKLTHLGNWGQALDFVVLDHTMKTYHGEGRELRDFYCYAKPILAPASGYIYNIIDFVEDNLIGGNNTKENWGNTLIIHHQNGLYTQISHLQKNGIKKKVGDYVHQGEIIAYCGNSGRSPEPHLHFQIQLSPEIGAKTYSYPIAYFIERQNQDIVFREFEIPREGTFVSNIEPNSKMKKAYSFLPGQTITAQNKKNNKIEQWKVYTDQYNQLYFYNEEDKTQAYFSSNEAYFYFTEFIGDKDSLLFHFYLSNYKVLLAHYPNMIVKDFIAQNKVTNKILLFLQDFISPFFIVIKALYTSSNTEVKETEGMQVSSYLSLNLFDFQSKVYKFDTVLRNEKISSIHIIDKGIEIELTY